MHRGDYATNIFQSSVRVHAPSGLALARASHSGEITLAASRRLRSTRTAAPVLFANAVITETEVGGIASPSTRVNAPVSRP